MRDLDTQDNSQDGVNIDNLQVSVKKSLKNGNEDTCIDSNQTNEMKAKQTCRQRGTKVLKDFCLNTSIQGLKQVAEPQQHIVRRYGMKINYDIY